MSLTLARNEREQNVLTHASLLTDFGFSLFSLLNVEVSNGEWGCGSF